MVMVVFKLTYEVDVFVSHDGSGFIHSELAQ
jgi:hypothetical protein